MINRVVHYSASSSSSGAGVLNDIYSLRPDSFSDWGSLYNLYDEYRILGAEIEIYCLKANSTAVTQVPTLVVYDNDDDITALANYTNALDYSEKNMRASVWNTGTPIRLKAACYSLTDSTAGREWFTTSTPHPAGTPSFKLFATGLSNSIAYFQVFVNLVVQFRGQT
jgi:hypothetical protein